MNYSLWMDTCIKCWFFVFKYMFFDLCLIFSPQGADYVEFDVQLSKDMIPVIYHDFHVAITYRKVRDGHVHCTIVVK